MHLADFPEDKIVVFLENDFREELISQAVSIFKGRKSLANYLKIRKLDTISRWKKGKIKRGKKWITPQGIPLDMVKKISEVLVSNGFNKFNLIEIENNVTTYKSRGKSLWIRNPQLPLEETPELFRIIAHMIGDGSAEEKSVNYFKNFDKKVLIEFTNDLKKVFGDVDLSFYENTVVFPVTIRHILSQWYGVSFGTFTAEVPPRLYELPPKYAAAFIRGFMDDEGNINTSCIRFYSFNQTLLKGVRKLVLEKFPEIQGIGKMKERRRVSTTGKKSKEYVFEIKSEGIRKYYDLIGTTHSGKEEKLNFYIRRASRDWNHRGKNVTKLMILKSLTNGPKTTRELSRETMISETSVRLHLKGYSQNRKKNAEGLIETGLVQANGLGKYNSNIWEITPEGVKFLNSYVISLKGGEE